MENEAKQIAKTIMQQIGQNSLMFVGFNQPAFFGEAENILGGLQFKCKGKHVKVGGKCRVELTARDEYNVIVGTFNSRHGWKEKGRVEGIHADQLSQAVEELIG